MGQSFPHESFGLSSRQSIKDGPGWKTRQIGGSVIIDGTAKILTKNTSKIQLLAIKSCYVFGLSGKLG